MTLLRFFTSALARLLKSSSSSIRFAAAFAVLDDDAEDLLKAYDKFKQGDGVDATGKPNTVLAMRRFKIKKGERYVVAEDVITKGGRVQETIDLVKASGGRVAAVIVLVDRSSGKVKFGRTPVFSLVKMTPKTWTAGECPMCAAGGKPVHPGS